MEWFRPRPRTPQEKLSTQDKILQLDEAIEQLIPMMERNIIGWAPQIQKYFESSGERYGIPREYMRWILGRPTSVWPRISDKERKLIRFGNSVRRAAHLYPKATPGVLPEGMESGLAMAFKDMANFMERKVVPAMERQDIKHLSSVGRRYLHLRRDDDPDPPLVDVNSQIGGYLSYMLGTRQAPTQESALLLSFLDLI